MGRDGDNDTGSAGTRGAPGAVQVGLVLGRRIVVDDEGDVAPRGVGVGDGDGDPLALLVNAEDDELARVACKRRAGSGVTLPSSFL